MATIESLADQRLKVVARDRGQLRDEIEAASNTLASIEELDGYALIAWNIDGVPEAYFYSGSVPPILLGQFVKLVIEAEQDDE